MKNLPIKAKFIKSIVSVISVCTVLFFSGCVSASERATVSAGIETYISHLKNGEYDLANEMVFDWDENDGITSDIFQNSVNDFIFNKLSYELWQINIQDGIYYADIVVNQLSLASAYGSTATEFSEYISQAESQGKSYSQHALDETFDKMLYKNLQNEEDYLKLKCTVPVKIVEGKISIGMTARFRNCLFGGELDAINSLSNN